MKKTVTFAIMLLMFSGVLGQKKEELKMSIFQPGTGDKIVIQKPDNMRCLVPSFPSNMPCLKVNVESRMPVQKFPGLLNPGLPQKNQELIQFFLNKQELKNKK